MMHSDLEVNQPSPDSIPVQVPEKRFRWETSACSTQLRDVKGWNEQAPFGNRGEQPHGTVRRSCRLLHEETEWNEWRAIHSFPPMKVKQGTSGFWCCFIIFNFYWSRITLKLLLFFYCTAKWINYMYTYIPSFWTSFPFRSAQSIEYETVYKPLCPPLLKQKADSS